ncbi:MAG: hypothetical protein WAV00_22250 [Nocardioides sp.]
MTPPPHELSSYDEIDAFDLPDWLGETEVTWASDRGLGTGHRVAGRLTAEGHDPVACDLLAVDDAYPEPVVGDQVRVRAHQYWRHGEVLLVGDGERVLLAVPGIRLDAETALQAVARLARAVGAPDGAYAVRLRVDRRP